MIADYSHAPVPRLGPPFHSGSVGAAGGDRQRAADLTHLGGVEVADEVLQLALVHGLHVVQVDGRDLFQPLVDADGDLARSATQGAKKPSRAETVGGSAPYWYMQMHIPEFP